MLALLGDRVTCPGVLAPATLARVYASADVCAQPAVIEELSNAVLEATSSGLPLMVAAGSGSERFVVEGKTGLVSREATPQAWAEALAELLRDPQRAAAMGRDAHAWSLSHAPTWQEVLVNDLLPAWRASRRASLHHGRTDCLTPAASAPGIPDSLMLTVRDQAATFLMLRAPSHTRTTGRAAWAAPAGDKPGESVS